MRNATPEDAERLSELDLLLFQGFNERSIRIELELGKGWVIGEPIIGYLLVRKDDTISDIIRLGVHPDFQKKGIGTDLLKEALKLGGPHMLTVEKTNAPAIHLYRRFGFKITGALPRGQHWVMVRMVGM